MLSSGSFHSSGPHASNPTRVSGSSRPPDSPHNRSRSEVLRRAQRDLSIILTIALLAGEIFSYISSVDPWRPGHLIPALVLMALTLAPMFRVFPWTLVYMACWAVITFLPGFNGAAFLAAFLVDVASTIINCTGRQMLASFMAPLVIGGVTAVIMQLRFAFFSNADVRQEFLILVVDIALSALAGLAIRLAVRTSDLRAEQAELRLTKTTAQRLERDIRLAGRMHDDLTNDLTTILTLAYAHKDDADEDWCTVSRLADRALSSAHSAIDVLRGRGEKTVASGESKHSDGNHEATSPEETSTEWRRIIEATARQETDNLHVLGFNGTLTFERADRKEDASAKNTQTDPVDPRAVDEARRLIREICQNIRRHGSKDGDWSLRIGEDQANKTIRILEMNTIDSGTSIIGTSGRGLALHHRTLKELGGSLETSAEDDTWILRAVVPLKS